MKLQPTKCKLRPSRGFTLIEMLVVMGIFAFLSGTLFINYSQFSVNASLDNLTHQVALIARQAQVYGISVSQAGSATQQFKGYGVYFSTGTSADQKIIILFNDKWGATNNGSSAPDKKYNSGTGSTCDGSDECQEKISIQSGDTVSLIKAREKTDPASALTLKEVHVVFTRPNPDANILGIDASDTQFDKLADVEVYLQSLRGTTKKVVVWSTGQIAVE